MDVDVSNLVQRRNLLAFSGGVDSSALFFLLREAGISFDIAIVNYAVRSQSIREVAYAKELAKFYGVECHMQKAPEYKSNFEAQARQFRYEFFESLIKKHGYQTLITAHHFDDMFEWFLMQLSKGAGLDEALGLEPVTQKQGYALVRPLLGVSKRELQAFVKSRGIHCYYDETNSDPSYKRNDFRRRFAAPLSREYEAGLKRSLFYLMQDKNALRQGIQKVFSHQNLHLYSFCEHNKIQAAAQALKESGYVMSAKQRTQLQKSDAIVLGGRFALGFTHNLLFLSPYRSDCMPKPFKESCRLLDIPKHNRPYIYSSRLDLSTLKRVIESSKR